MKYGISNIKISEKIKHVLREKNDFVIDYRENFNSKTRYNIVDKLKMYLKKASLVKLEKAISDSCFDLIADFRSNTNIKINIHCLFHDDKNPSSRLTFSKNYISFQCYKCNKQLLNAKLFRELCLLKF